MIFRFLRLSKVRILTEVASQAKKVTLNGALLCQIHLQRKKGLSWDIYTIEPSHVKQPFLRGIPTKLVYIALSQFDGTQLIKKRRK
jgi:hypothetical protein